MPSSQSVSRVLCPLRPSIWDCSCLQPQAANPGLYGVGPTPVPKDSPPIWPCSGRGLASRCVSTPADACRDTQLVRSYRTISPLVAWWRPVCFCATFRRVTPPGCYPAPCPVELGLFSAAHPEADDRGRSAHSSSIVAHAHDIGRVLCGTCMGGSAHVDLWALPVFRRWRLAGLSARLREVCASSP